MVCIIAATAVNAQKWSDMTDEQKMMQLKSFRADNQNYLKNTLGMTEQQMTDIDNVNICYLSTLDRISRYAKDDATKEKYADALARDGGLNWMPLWEQTNTNNMRSI